MSSTVEMISGVAAGVAYMTLRPAEAAEFGRPCRVGCPGWGPRYEASRCSYLGCSPFLIMLTLYQPQYTRWCWIRPS
jgi:hypothetical protein